MRKFIVAFVLLGCTTGAAEAGCKAAKRRAAASYGYGCYSAPAPTTYSYSYEAPVQYVSQPAPQYVGNLPSPVVPGKVTPTPVPPQPQPQPDPNGGGIVPPVPVNTNGNNPYPANTPEHHWWEFWKLKRRQQTPAPATDPSPLNFPPTQPQP